MVKTLRFRARGTALVTHFEKLDAGVRSFVGRKLVQIGKDSFGFAPTGADEEVPYRAEYVHECQEKNLWAADQETAVMCGVEFDPSFGAPRVAAEEKSEQ